MPKKQFLLISLFMSVVISMANAQSVKGLYVDNFDEILGNTVKEDSLLNYAEQNGFNYLTLYDLWPIHVTYDLTNAGTCIVLAEFIENAKQNYGILEVGATGENFFFFNNVIQIYNSQHGDPLQRFDVYNVEFEFWNTTTVSPGNYYCTTYLQPEGYSCDVAGAFSFYEKLIRQVDSLANIEGVISETYVGWFDEPQAIIIGNTVDRILLHDYISDYGWLYSYIDTRLEYIAARNVLTDVIPIFSAEPNFMGPWLSSNNVATPYNDLEIFLDNETAAWKQFINMAGYQWFAYSFMPYTLTASVEEVDGVEAPEIFPNPCNGVLKLDVQSQETTSIKIFDPQGRIVLEETALSSDLEIDVSNLISGNYIVEVRMDGRIFRKKLIVN